MALITISRGPWIIDTTTITNTARNSDPVYNVIVTTVVGGNAFDYALTVAEAITLSVTIPQIPPVVPSQPFVGALFPNTNIGLLGTESAGGRGVVIAWGVATTDAAIVAQIGADALWADGSLYLSVVAGGGSIFEKVNDVWLRTSAFTGAAVYEALLTQAAGAAPVATVLQNGLSGPIVWARTSAGLYTGTLASAFPAAKTAIYIGSNAAILPATTFDVIQSQRTNTNVVTIQTSLVTLSAGPPPTGVATDSILNETAIRIIVYP